MAISKSNIKSRRKPHVIALTEIYNLHRMSHHSADLSTSTRCFFFHVKIAHFVIFGSLGNLVIMFQISNYEEKPSHGRTELSMAC
jgi:hypothetical protein